MVSAASGIARAVAAAGMLAAGRAGLEAANLPACALGVVIVTALSTDPGDFDKSDMMAL